MFKKITVIGLGLMGGSLAAACRKKFPKSMIVGVSRSEEALELAKKKKWVHEVTREVLFGAEGSDLVVLCTPVNAFMPYLEAIDKVCSPGAVVIDVGSVKAAVLKQVNSRKWKNLSFVGCHPMVGSHRRGVQAVNPALYKDGLVILTRDSKTCSHAYKTAMRFWKSFTSKVVEVSPAVHDRLVGEISHLPHAIASCLMHTVSLPAMKVASTGFRDTTRIAASASSIWLPIFTMNREVMLEVLERFKRELGTFQKLLERQDLRGLERFWGQAAQKRKAL